MRRYRLVINLLILLAFLSGVSLISGKIYEGFKEGSRAPALPQPAAAGPVPGAGGNGEAVQVTNGSPNGLPAAGGVQAGNSLEAGNGPSPTGLRPNELGKVMILEYHLIGDKEDRWERRYDNFRQDLERLYREGYRLISLVDYLENNIRVPAGYTPVILTFDDGSRGQFNFLEKDGQLVVDPKSAVGILLDFAKEHPDFGTAATFYTLFPPFGQPKYWKEKVRFLVEHGMDIGNHTLSHSNLGKLSPAEIAREVGGPVKLLKEVLPTYEVKTLALPYGLLPKDDSAIRAGTYAGVPYRNLAILLVGAEPARSVNDRLFNPYRLPRVQAISSELDRWLGYFARHPEERYVSDGDPSVITIPEKLKGQLNAAATAGKTVQTYR